MLEINKIHNIDCMDGFDRLEDNSVDILCIDPPYFLPALHYNTRKEFRRNFADIGIVEHFFRDIFQKIKRVMKDDGFLYIFCDGQSYPIFYYHLYPFVKHLRPIIWDKKVSINGYTWRHQHELILFSQMPKAKGIPTGDGDIVRFNAVKVGERIHPAQKPVQLLVKLLGKHTKNSLVLDCFAGSGSCFEACKILGMNFIGFEKEQQYFQNKKRRIEK